MKHESASATATVKDSRKDSATSGQDVEVNYGFDFDVLETKEEAEEVYSWPVFLKMWNQKAKATANSGARQKAISPYLPDPADPAQKRESLIKNMISVCGIPRDIAEQQVDSLLALGAK